MNEPNTLKAAPKLNYRRLSILLSISLIISLLFFEADEWLGAVQLRGIYTTIAIGLSVSLCFFSARITFGETIFPTQNRVEWLIIGGIVSACAIVFGPTIALVSWIFPIYLMLMKIRLEIVLIALILSIILQIILIPFAVLKSRLLIKAMLVFVAMFTSVYIISMSGVSRSVNVLVHSGLQLGDKYYFAYTQEKLVSSFGDYLTLYECNQIALMCQTIYATNGWWYGIDGPPRVEFTTEIASLTVVVNGEALYTYNP